MGKVCNQAFVKDKYRDTKFAGTMKCFRCGETSNLPPLPIEMKKIIIILDLFNRIHDAKGCNEKQAKFTKDASGKINLAISN